jgi:hypothetical protein
VCVFRVVVNIVRLAEMILSTALLQYGNQFSLVCDYKKQQTGFWDFDD